MDAASDIGGSSDSAPAAVCRHDWYQTDSHVIVTVLAKNLDPQKVGVAFAERMVVFNAQLADGRHYVLELVLSKQIVPGACTYSVLRSKVELVMAKCEGVRWSTLEDVSDVKTLVDPSSSTKKRDWDKIGVQISKDLDKEKPDGEAALKQLFQTIYRDGSDQVRKAMNKSFQESGGTVLSTNWDQVANEKVAVKIPDGREFRKWN